MWAHYRKTLLPIQFMIIGITVALYFGVHMPGIAVAVFFVVMELGSLIGAAWAARLRRKMDPDRLPLQR